MNDTVNNAEASTGAEAVTAAVERKRAPAANFLPIVRGRLPLLFVHAVRYDKVVNAMDNKSLSTKFATSVGKIFDVKKGRNFAYIGENYKPTEEDLKAAEAWIAQVGAENAKGLTAAGDKVLMEKIVADYRSRGLATPEDVAQLAAAKAAAKPAAPATGGTPATNGASTKSGGKGKAPKAEKTTEPGAAAGLLA